MVTNPKDFNPPKNLWISKRFEFDFPISSESCKTRILNSCDAKMYSSDEKQFMFVAKVGRRSSAVAVGEILPTDAKSCKVIGRAGVERNTIILVLAVFAILVWASWSTLSHQQIEQFSQLNLFATVLFLFIVIMDFGALFDFISKLKHIDERSVS